MPPRGRKGILAPGGRAASTRAPGTSGKTWRLPGSRQEGPGVARTRRGCGACGRRSPAGAGPGRTVRTTGPAKGNPVPARPARAAGSRRRPPKPALGGRLHPRADLVGVLLHGLRHGACSPAGSSAGPPAAARGTDNAVGAPGQAIRAAQAPRRPMPDRPGPPQRPRIQVTCPSPTPDDSSTRAPIASAGAVGSSYAGAAEALGKPLQARGPFWRDGPWKDRDDPRGRHRPVGEPVPTAPDPTAPTPTTSHPPPPNTATIATTPPPPRHPPRHNQPSTKPRTIHSRSRCGRWATSC